METDKMACPKDGTEYVTIGDKRVCPKCGHTAGYKQIDIVELLEETKRLKEENEQLKQTITQMNKEISQMPLRPHRIEI